MPVDASPRPFESVLASLTSASYDDCRVLPESKVESHTAFEEMRYYLRDLYQGVTVVSSIVDTDGQVIDCIPADQYPGAKRWREDAKVIAPPTAQPAPALVPAPLPASASGAAPEAYGVVRRHQYPPGTIPMYRTTLEQLARFENLAAFHAKAAEKITEVSAFPKKYATGEQDIHCLGGGSHINVWKPFATPSFQSTFSQQWYVAGHDGTWMQTVECGWHIDIARYQNAEPHLFVYSTRQNYDNGHSFFNLDGGVYQPVPNPYVLPGAPLTVSQTDGNQVAHKMGFYLTAGAWWFYFDDRPVGYYPLPWFLNGPLATGARRIKFGGEVGTNLSFWPPMGSGRHASAGHARAAYQRAAFVNPVTGGGFNANLAVAGSTNGPCYTIDITNNSPTAWGTYLYFGGPGGQPC